jgi:hypothetical protein
MMMMLKHEVSEALCVLCSNLERVCSKKSTLLFKFETKFHSRAKGNPWETVMLCRPTLYALLAFISATRVRHKTDKAKETKLVCL